MKIAFKRIHPLVFIEVAFLLLVLNGCNLQPPGKRFSDPASFTTINISDIQDNQFIINDIINSVKFIPLEFKDECLIHSILKLDFYNDTIFILSRDGLYLFNTEGKYICQIGSKGQGPGEYILPFDFSIDKQNKQAIIYDSNKRKIQIYDLSGNFLKSVQIGMSWNIEPFGNDLFLNYPMNIMGDQPYSLMIVNQNGDTIKTFDNKFKFELLGTPFLVPVIGAMYKFQNNIHFKQFLSDTLYVFNSKSLKIIPKYVFQGMKNLPTRMLGNIEQYNKEAINYSWLDRILETENYLFIRLNSYGKSEYMIYDKNKKKLFSVQTDIKNDIQTKRINLSTFFWPNYKLSDNIIIKPWTAYRFKKDFNDVVSDKESMAILTEYGLDNFFQFYESVNENDNPIIQIIFLK